MKIKTPALLTGAFLLVSLNATPLKAVADVAVVNDSVSRSADSININYIGIYVVDLGNIQSNQRDVIANHKYTGTVTLNYSNMSTNFDFTKLKITSSHPNAELTVKEYTVNPWNNGNSGSITYQIELVFTGDIGGQYQTTFTTNYNSEPISFNFNITSEEFEGGDKPSDPNGGDEGGNKPSDPNGGDEGGNKPSDPNGGDEGGNKPSDPDGGDEGGDKPSDPNGGDEGGNKPSDPNGVDEGDNKPSDPNGVDEGDNKPSDPNGGDEGGNKPSDPNGGDEGGNKPSDPNGGDESGNKPSDPDGGDEGGNKPSDPNGGDESGNKPSDPDGGDEGGDKPSDPNGGDEGGDKFSDPNENDQDGVTPTDPNHDSNQGNHEDPTDVTPIDPVQKPANGLTKTNKTKNTTKQPAVTQARVATNVVNKQSTLPQTSEQKQMNVSYLGMALLALLGSVWYFGKTKRQ